MSTRKSLLTDLRSRFNPKLFVIDNFVWVLLLTTLIVFAIINGSNFFNLTNLRFVVFSTVALGFLVIAEGICLISGNFDLSVGQTAGFAAMLNGLILTTWFPSLPWYVGVGIIILIGIIIGAVNGILIGYIGLNPFLVTLGTYFILQYGTLELNLQSIRDGFPENYLLIGGGDISGVPVAVPILLSVVILLHVIFNHMKIGARIYSIGNDKQSAARLGSNVERTVFITFIISGSLSAVAGLMFTGFLGSVTPGVADGSLFMAFAGAVLGGTSLSGGRGSVINMLAGALLIGVSQSGLIMTGASGNQVNIFFGILVITAILINSFRENLRNKLLHP
jgi:ribose/xylose/arabinose/galactoside ABC-type transport system permease subunit